jgi:hypothetical protein
MNKLKMLWHDFFDLFYCVTHKNRDNLCDSCSFNPNYPICESSKWRFNFRGDSILKCNGYKKVEKAGL